MCVELEQLKKENAALKAGRAVSYEDDDLDIDQLSDTSETRDYLHAQLAKHNVRKVDLPHLGDVCHFQSTYMRVNDSS